MLIRAFLLLLLCVAAAPEPAKAETAEEQGLAFGAKKKSALAPVAPAVPPGEGRRAWLGVSVQSAETAAERFPVVKGSKGAVVVQIDATGPAAGIDLKAGDVIVAVDGETVETMQDLPRIVQTKSVGATIALDRRRDGAVRTTFVTLGYRDSGASVQPAARSDPPPAPPAPEPPARPVLGLTLAKLTEDLRARYRVDDHLNGVVVTRVEPKSPAARKRIKPGHVILEVAGGPVEGPADVVRSYENDIAKGGSVTLLLMSSTTTAAARYVALDHR